MGVADSPPEVLLCCLVELEEREYPLPPRPPRLPLPRPLPPFTDDGAMVFVFDDVVPIAMGDSRLSCNLCCDTLDCGGAYRVYLARHLLLNQ